MASKVMGPDVMIDMHDGFNEKIAPAFDGHNDYSAYRHDVLLWEKLTSLSPEKRGIAIIGRLFGEPKAAAKTVDIDLIVSDRGVQHILAHLDKSYLMDSTDKLDMDLAAFLDYKWESYMSVEQFVAGFHTRLDKIASLQIDAKLKGHLLLRQACLDHSERNMIVGASSGSYDVGSITASLKQAFRLNKPISSVRTHFEGTPEFKNKRKIYETKHPRKFYRNSNSNPSNDSKRSGQPEQKYLEQFQKSMHNNSKFGEDSKPPPTFVTQNYPSENPVYAILDTGACGSVVGEKTLIDVMNKLGMKFYQKEKPLQVSHRFGNNSTIQKTLFSVKMPIYASAENKDHVGERIYFNIKFDVIKGDLPFLIGLPSLSSMQASINFKYKNLGLYLNGKYYRVPYVEKDHHICLALIANYTKSAQTASSYYSSPGYSGQIYSSDTVNDLSSYFSESLGKKEIRKIHLQLRHGSKTEIINWLKAANKWKKNLNPIIDEVIEDCGCSLASPPSPHPVASITPPSSAKHEKACMDIVFLESTPILHVIDKATGWSETGILRSRRAEDQVKLFKSIYTLRHGAPKIIYADNEFKNSAFEAFCHTNDIELISIAANAHESNGSIERANRTLRTIFNRIRSFNQKSPLSEIVSEATFGKNITKGNKMASSYELIFGHKPRIFDEIDCQADKSINIEQENEHKSRSRLNTMLRSNVRKNPDFQIGQPVYIWRDNNGWIGPAKLFSLDRDSVTVIHNGALKTSSYNRTRKAPTIFSADDSDEENDEGKQDAGDTSTSHDEENDSEKYSSPANSDDHSDEEYNEHFTPNGSADQHAEYGTRLRSGRVSTARDLTVESSDRESDDSDEDWIPARRSSYYTKNSISEEAKKIAYQNEKRNWINLDAMETVDITEVPRNANIIGSHVLYRQKDDGRTKARICPWGNKDIEKHWLETDCPCMNMEIFRLLLSIASENKWTIGEMDVTAAFLQSNGFSREIYVRPPKEEQSPRKLWRLLAGVYGLVDSGKLWYITSNDALTSKGGLTKSKFEPTLYYRKNGSELVFLLVTQVDNYIYCGTNDEIKRFENFLQAEFDIGELKHKSFTLYGCEIHQSTDMSITLSQQAKIESLTANLAIGTHDRKPDSPALPQEVTQYKSVLGKLLFIGRLSQPIALFHASRMASKTSNLLRHHLNDLDAIIRAQKKNSKKISFLVPTNTDQFSIDIYTDAAMAKKNGEKSRAGFIIFRRNGDMVHPIHWSSRNLRRVARSSSTAELLSAADALDSALYLQAVHAEVSYEPEINLSSDSKSLCSLIPTIKEPEESLNKVDLAALRESYQRRLLKSVSWTPGHYMIADALTKENRVIAEHLRKVLASGTYPIHPSTQTTSKLEGNASKGGREEIAHANI